MKPFGESFFKVPDLCIKHNTVLGNKQTAGAAVLLATCNFFTGSAQSVLLKYLDKIKVLFCNKFTCPCGEI